MSTQASIDTPVTADVDELVGEWLTVPDLAEALDLDVVKARQLLKDGTIVCVRRGERGVISVPAAFIEDGAVLTKIPGLLTLLRDAGYDENESLRWIFTPDDTLPGSPIQAIVENRHTEVRRRAQSLAF
ncbi:MAG: Rv2175c family DNA-binding protein [Actinomycetes bacterium]